MTTASSGPVRLAIVNDYEIVVAGVANMLAEYHDRVSIVELDARLPVLSDVDVVLYDTFGRARDDVSLSDLVDANQAKVVIFSWRLDAAAVERAIGQGAAGCLSKGLTALMVVESLEMVRDGRTVIRPRAEAGDSDPSGDWPGRAAGLSPRESEILAFITQGLSNQEIAERLYLSINSVKTYIRTAYRKTGVTRRSQAVRWGMEHGFLPDRTRVTEPTAAPGVATVDHGG